MSLDNLKKRINYRGGARQVDRMIEDKERSFKQSLFRSYQSATAVLEDGREFRCLINPNKISMEADDKMLSIPFKDICLNKKKPENTTTSDGQEEIGVKCGDLIIWKENGTHWLVYSQYLQEVAYFRGLMRQCDAEVEWKDDSGKKHSRWVYLKGPDEKGIDWQKTKHFIFNDLNYTVEIYISNTTEINEFFQRFKKVKIKGKPFEVQAVDRLSTDGILTVYLKEDFENIWEETALAPDVEDEIQPPVEEAQTFTLRRSNKIVIPEIQGPTQVYPYDTVTYNILNPVGGKWLLSNKRASIKEVKDNSVTIDIITGKSGSVSLIYRQEGMEDIVFNIEILSL